MKDKSIDEILKRITSQEDQKELDNAFQSTNIQEGVDKYLIQQYKIDELNNVKKLYLKRKKKGPIAIAFGISVFSIGMGALLYTGIESNLNNQEYKRLEYIFQKETKNIRDSTTFILEIQKDDQIEKLPLKFDSFSTFVYNFWNHQNESIRKDFSYYGFEYFQNINQSKSKIEEIKNYNLNQWTNYITDIKNLKGLPYNIDQLEYVDLITKESELTYRDASDYDGLFLLIFPTVLWVFFVIAIVTSISIIVKKATKTIKEIDDEIELIKNT